VDEKGRGSGGEVRPGALGTGEGRGEKRDEGEEALIRGHMRRKKDGWMEGEMEHWNRSVPSAIVRRRGLITTSARHTLIHFPDYFMCA